MKKFPVSNELSNEEFYNNDFKGNGGVMYDGNQENGRQGSPFIGKPSDSFSNTPDFGGKINYDNTQTKFGDVSYRIDDDMQWETKNKVVYDPTKKFKDVSVSTNGFQMKEVDLSKHIDCIGMPNPNINHNSSDDCYGGY